MQNSPKIFPVKPVGSWSVPVGPRPQWRPERAVRFNVLHEIFEDRVDAQPDAIAVICGRARISYRELEARANRLAHHLRRRGVRRGSRVALLLPRSVEAYATLLGILKAGAAYVPLDPEYPADRVAFILANGAATALVTTADLAQRQESFRGAVVRVDADAGPIAAESAVRLPHNAVGVGPATFATSSTPPVRPAGPRA